ncbi:maestro heat-like repeat-containing protein family member 7 [Molothrus aeneus]|uniref:maestro heat-like repeat-containing protein family member 7 n=1 Tax=Molothrus aeneus TaxID=84833 RepID=UPI003457FEE0
MEQRDPRVPKLLRVEEEEEGRGPAPTQETKEEVTLGLPQEGAVLERTQEQEPARGLFRRTAQMPALVRYIHQWLLANQFAEHRLNRSLLDLTYGAHLPRALRAPQPISLYSLAQVSEQQRVPGPSGCSLCKPWHAIVVMWKILQVPCVPHMVTVYFPHLFVHLLFQVFLSTLDMPEEVDAFWKGCQEQYGLATSPNRFAVRTLKSLLCHMQHEDVVVAIERKHAWDTLLCADTHHYAMALLAREMCCVSIPLCSRIARYLLRLLSTQEPRWELPGLAFLVEVLQFLDLSQRGANRVLPILSRQLQSECRERRRLALRALLELIEEPFMTKKMWNLTESLVQFLWDADGEIVFMTVMLLSFIILDKDTMMPGPITLLLLEALLPLFDHNNSQVQLLSILLFRTLVTLPERENEKKALKTPLHQSLLPLFFHCHDDNQLVAQASQESLLCVAEFLKRRDLERLVKNQNLWKFSECLLAEDSSRAAEHLRQALPYLQSPQESLRAAAIRFTGMAARHLRGKKEELRLIYNALQHLTEDTSSALSDVALATLHVLQALQSEPYSVFQRLQDQLRRAWRTRPGLSALGWLRCCSSAES